MGKRSRRRRNRNRNATVIVDKPVSDSSEAIEKPRCEPSSLATRIAIARSFFDDHPHARIKDCWRTLHGQFGIGMDANQIGRIRNEARVAQGFEPIGSGYRIKRVSSKDAKEKTPDAEFLYEHGDLEREIAELADMACGIEGLAAIEIEIDALGKPTVRYALREIRMTEYRQL